MKSEWIQKVNELNVLATVFWYLDPYFFFHTYTPRILSLDLQLSYFVSLQLDWGFAPPSHSNY